MEFEYRRSHGLSMEKRNKEVAIRESRLRLEYAQEIIPELKAKFESYGHSLFSITPYGSSSKEAAKEDSDLDLLLHINMNGRNNTYLFLMVYKLGSSILEQFKKEKVDLKYTLDLFYKFGFKENDENEVWIDDGQGLDNDGLF